MKSFVDELYDYDNTATVTEDESDEEVDLVLENEDKVPFVSYKDTNDSDGGGIESDRYLSSF